MSNLPVGHPTRRTIRSALRAAFTVAVLFAAVTILSKEDTALNLQQPWQDDPYDVLVSLDLVILPVLIGIGVLRSLLCQRHRPLPARRLADILRVAGAALGACLITETAEWIAVILGRHRATWTVSTIYQIGVLGLLTAATLCASARTRRATREVSRATTITAQPDWLTDLVALGLHAANATRSSRGTNATHWVDEHVVTRIRQHPVAAACVVAAALGSPFIAAKIVIEHYPPSLVLVASAFIYACMFALVISVGRYLRIVTAKNTELSPTMVAALAGTVSGTTLFAFHDLLLPHQTVTGLAVLLLGGGAAGVAASIAIRVSRRRLSTRHVIGECDSLCRCRRRPVRSTST